MKKTEKLRQLFSQPEIIIAPGAYDALTAKLIEQAGFKVVYVTGAGVSNTQLGKPDVGLICMEEMLSQVRKIVSATTVPVIADADTGYGNAINVMRTVKEFERAGVAAIQLEDQVFPKRCGHFAGKMVVSKAEMVNKIQAAVEAKEDDDFFIIARTDARAIYGLEEAIERAKAYIEAGADATFVEAPRSIEELRKIPYSINAPQVANMVEGGLTPLVTAEELQKMGFKMVIYANCVMRAGVKAIINTLHYLKKHGTTKGILDNLISMDERNRITGLPEIQVLEKKYSVSVKGKIKNEKRGK